METTISEDSSTATKQKGQVLKLIYVKGKVTSKRKTINECTKYTASFVKECHSNIKWCARENKLFAEYSNIINTDDNKDCSSNGGNDDDYSNNSSSRRFKLDSC